MSERFDKYEMYEGSVQNPEADLTFLNATFLKHRKRTPRVLQEDFCGTFALARAWVAQSSSHRAYGYDVDSEPLAFGRTKIAAELSSDEALRLRIFKRNVLAPTEVKNDIIVGLNFSYFIFRQRETLKSYIRRCYDGLAKDGMLFLDSIGGPACMAPNESRRKLKGFDYFWELEDFDPIQNRAKFSIQFRLAGETRRRRLFTYDWRLWTIPEVREIMEEVGFRRSYVYWEGTNRKGEGNGVFTRRESGEACETWVCYVVGER